MTVSWGEQLVVTELYEPIIAMSLCLKGCRECDQSVGYFGQKRTGLINEDCKNATQSHDTLEKCTACAQQVREGARIPVHTLGKLA